MMGTKERNFHSLPDDISLQDLVPKDNATAGWRSGSTSPLSGNWSRISTLPLAAPALTQWSFSSSN